MVTCSPERLWDTSELARIYLLLSPTTGSARSASISDRTQPCHRAINDATATENCSTVAGLCSAAFRSDSQRRILELSRQAQLDSHLSKLMEQVVGLPEEILAAGLEDRTCLNPSTHHRTQMPASCPA